jgi:uncharacterized protein DUF899
MTNFMRDEIGVPKIVDRATFQAELDALRVREKAHTHEGDAIAAAGGPLPMVEVDSATRLISAHGASAYWTRLKSAGCSSPIINVARRKTRAGATRGVHLGHYADNGVVISPFSRRNLRGILPGTARRDRALRFYGLADAVVFGPGLARHPAGRTADRQDAYLLLPPTRSKVFETYWTTARGVDVMDNSYHLLDLTVYGRRESWEESPVSWPQQFTYRRTSTGSPTWQGRAGVPLPSGRGWDGGRSDDLETGALEPRSGNCRDRPVNSNEPDLCAPRYVSSVRPVGDDSVHD